MRDTAGVSMMKRVVWLLFCMMMGVGGGYAAAQSTGTETLVFVWNDEIYAHTIGESSTLATSRPYAVTLPLPDSPANVFSYADSRLTAPPVDDFGFYQGVRSPDGTALVFLALEPRGAGYHILMAENGVQRRLFTGEITRERGYLVPVGWSEDGTLFLLERHSLHTLNRLRLWRYQPAEQTVTLEYESALPNLKGNSAMLNGGRVFIGFETVGQLGYVFNLNTRQLTTFLTSFALKDPPASVFEVYPVAVVALTQPTVLQAWLETPAPASDDIGVWEGEPFLHWPLPNDFRSITCYPDSEWTDITFAVECPGLATPRTYQGHEGTDVGGKPDGLALGTPVYAVAPGVVIDVLGTCIADDITCGDAYGNHVLIEHAIVVHHQVEVWFTGYAHLQNVLVERDMFVRDIGLPIALSGASGFGGAHLHLEIRSPRYPARANWVDPWDVRPVKNGASLWVMDDAGYPISAVVAHPPPTLLTCQTIDGNNIRGGPGTEHPVVRKSSAGETYQVFQVRNLTTGGALGDWYHVRWSEPDVTGWLWADLMTDCTA